MAARVWEEARGAGPWPAPPGYLSSGDDVRAYLSNKPQAIKHGPLGKINPFVLSAEGFALPPPWPWLSVALANTCPLFTTQDGPWDFSKPRGGSNSILGKTSLKQSPSNHAISSDPTLMLVVLRDTWPGLVS